MPKSLAEYAEWLSERNLRWPTPPRLEPVKATPHAKPLPGIKAVAWDIYGTLLRITDGELLFQPSQAMRLEMALEKTVQEFHLGNGTMQRPGASRESILELYTRIYDERRLRSSDRKGDLCEVDASQLWHEMLGLLTQNEYVYDVGLYGDRNEFSQKIAYFFHGQLQGVEAGVGALHTLTMIARSGLVQGVIADGQCFTLVQMLRGLQAQGTLPPIGRLFDSTTLTLSCQESVRKPSKSLFIKAIERFQARGVAPAQVLFVSARLREDLAVAKALGMKTVLFAGDKVSLRAAGADLKDAAVKPDRMITELPQIREILSI